MPAKYEKIRDNLEAHGASEKKAKQEAAAIFNKHRKPGEAPVTGNSDKKRGYHKVKNLLRAAFPKD
jgi:hypothetical protein